MSESKKRNINILKVKLLMFSLLFFLIAHLLNNGYFIKDNSYLLGILIDNLLTDICLIIAITFITISIILILKYDF